MATVGLEWAHAQFLGQGEGLLVVGFGGRDVQWVTTHGNLTEEVQGICLVTSLLVLTGNSQCALGEGARLLQVANQHLCLSQSETAERLSVCSFRRRALLYRLCEQGHGVIAAPAQGIRCP